MNRRDLLKAIPSVSLVSIFNGDLDLRKMYIEYVFPQKYDVTTHGFEKENIKYYDAMYLDTEKKLQIHYTWNNQDKSHKYNIRLYQKNPLRMYTLIKGECESTIQAREVLEKQIDFERKKELIDIDN